MDQDFLGKGMKFPPEVKNNRFVACAGEELIEQSILTILCTSKGERVMRPDFGCNIHELVFAPNNTTTATLVAFHIKEALKDWEPRITLEKVTAVPDNDERNRLNINIEYIIKTTNTKKNLVYPFYLEVNE